MVENVPHSARRPDDAPDELSHPVGGRVGQRDPAGELDAERHSRVDVAAGHRPERVGECHEREPERQRRRHHPGGKSSPPSCRNPNVNVATPTAKYTRRAVPSSSAAAFLPSDGTFRLLGCCWPTPSARGVPASMTVFRTIGAPSPPRRERSAWNFASSPSPNKVPLTMSFSPWPRRPRSAATAPSSDPTTI